MSATTIEMTTFTGLDRRTHAVLQAGAASPQENKNRLSCEATATTTGSRGVGSGTAKFLALELADREIQTQRQPAVVRDGIPSATDKDLPASFAEIHALYSRRLYKTIIAITKNPADAEDALQDTFLRVHLALDKFEGRSSIYTWLSQIAINSALIILRKRRIRHEELFDPQQDFQVEGVCFQVRDTALNPEEQVELQQRQLKVLHAIRRLAPDLRRPIRMRMIHGWSMREISRALNISIAAVKARLHRARARLSMMKIDTRHSVALRCSGGLPGREATKQHQPSANRRCVAGPSGTGEARNVAQS